MHLEHLCVPESTDLDLVDLTYLEDFPGLIHFICVDRSTGQMIAPSLNITEHTTSELGKGPVAQFIKSKVKHATAQRHQIAVTDQESHRMMTGMI